ncbi:MAG: hypothetical protein QHI48_07500 [Bacteroidota bacterium]|nr:hypothetical protein [Bacteroidota bacterium]
MNHLHFRDLSVTVLEIGNFEPKPGVRRETSRFSVKNIPIGNEPYGEWDSEKRLPKWFGTDGFYLLEFLVAEPGPFFQWNPKPDSR